ncbi:MAG: hypothetical protein KQJ78_15095 [Deltaproteobacteria bacterium]|nr:hypothetical protein [Deltaproteobacteria bacterium]
MAQRLDLEDLRDRIACFAQFDRDDETCLTHCSLNFDCAAARERSEHQEFSDHSMVSLAYPHSA